MEFTTEQGCRLLVDLASFGAPRPLLVLTGGDPFERPHVPEHVGHSTWIGLNMAPSPSVTNRLTRTVLVELCEAGAKAVSLSLDGARALSHDSFRGVDGVFDATFDADRTVREVGFPLQINISGSVGDQSFPEIHRDSELLQQLCCPEGFDGRLGQCEFRAVCGGSRSHAYATTRDPLAVDPSYHYQPVPDSDVGLIGELTGPDQSGDVQPFGRGIRSRLWLHICARFRVALVLRRVGIFVTDLVW